MAKKNEQAKRSNKKKYLLFSLLALLLIGGIAGGVSAAVINNNSGQNNKYDIEFDGQFCTYSKDYNSYTAGQTATIDIFPSTDCYLSGNINTDKIVVSNADIVKYSLETSSFSKVKIGVLKIKMKNDNAKIKCVAKQNKHKLSVKENELDPGFKITLPSKTEGYVLGDRANIEVRVSDDSKYEFPVEEFPIFCYYKWIWKNNKKY